MPSRGRPLWTGSCVSTSSGIRTTCASSSTLRRRSIWLRSRVSANYTVAWTAFSSRPHRKSGFRAQSPHEYARMMVSTLLILFLSFVQVGLSGGGDRPQRGVFALENARIVTVTNGTIERGTLVIRDDRIVAVGTDVEVPAEAIRIDCEGLSIYPGMIDAGTRLGLAEIGSVQETNDDAEIGAILPHMQALTAVNPNSVLIPVTRVSGVTTVLTEPSGGLVPGTAALINLHGYTPEQMLLGGVRPVVVNFPSRARRGSRDERSREDRQKEFEEQLDVLDELFDRAALHVRIDSAYQGLEDAVRQPEYAPAAEALAPVLRGEARLIVKANRIQQIT